MATYLVRDIDPDLWRQVKSRAALEGVPVRSVILTLLKAFATGKVETPPRRQKARA